MSKIYQYVVRLKDEATSKLNQLARAAGLMDTNLQKSTDTARRASGVFSDLGGKLRTAAAAMGLFLSVQSGIGAVQDVARLETYSNAIEFSGGSMDFVRKTAKDLHLDLMTTADGYRQLSAATMGSALQGKATEEIFRGVSTAVASGAVPADKVGNVFYALNNIMSKGVLTSEELNQQLGDALPGALQMAADAMGVTREKLLELVQDRKISALEFLPRFAQTLQTKFAPALEKAGKSLQAGLNDINTSFIEAKEAGVMAFRDQIVGAMTFIKDTAVPAFGSLLTWMGQNKTMLSQMAVAASVLATVYYGMVGAQKLVAWWTGASTTAFYAQYIATYGLSGAWTVLNAVMKANPIGFIITLLAALVAGVIWAWNNVDWFRAGLMGLWEAAKYVFGGIWEWLKTYVLPPLMGLWEVFKIYILPVLGQVWEAIKKLFSWVWEHKNLLLAPFMPLVYLLDKIAAFKGVKAAFDKGYNSEMSTTNLQAIGGGNSPKGMEDWYNERDDRYLDKQKDKGSKALNDISNGGRRSNNITLNVNNKFDIKTSSEKEAAQKTAKTFAEELFRELNGAILAVNQ